jgi:hypothetical protein
MLNTGQFYLPSELNCSVRFMKDILVGSKSVSKFDDEVDLNLRVDENQCSLIRACVSSRVVSSSMFQE